jgi:hypothetical protein
MPAPIQQIAPQDSPMKGAPVRPERPSCSHPKAKISDR